MPKRIPLFYWSERKFIFKEKENYGDLLSRYLVEKITGKEVKFVQPKKQPWYRLNKEHYVVIGSVLHHTTKQSIVWGSGIIDRKHDVARADFRAVRGPRTRDFLLEKGYECPPVYGDPAILLPKYFSPTVQPEYKYGVIPHYHDYEQARDLFSGHKGVKVIDLMTMDVEAVTKEILNCKKCLSSSLHGLIVAHAFGIPCVWVKFSDKLFGDGIKFSDYFESVEIEEYTPHFIEESNVHADVNVYFSDRQTLPEINMEHLREGLMAVCPFK